MTIFSFFSLVSGRLSIMATGVLSGAYKEYALIVEQKFPGFLQTVVPPEAVYNTCRVGPAGQRQIIEFPADSAQYSFRDSKAVIRLQSKGLLSFPNAFLEFSAVATSSTGQPFFSTGIWNIFNRIRVMCGGQVIVDQPMKNDMRSLQWAAVRSIQSDQTLGAACWGVDDISKRITRGAGYNYAIPLDVSMFTSDEIPFAHLSNGVQIELYFENPQACVNFVDPSVGTNPGYTINNLRVRCEEVFYQSDLQNDILGYPNILLPYTNFKSFQFNIPPGSNSNQFNIPVRVQGVKRMIWFMRNSADVSNVASYDTKVSQFLKNKCLEYQVKIDNTYFPPQPIKTQQLTANEVTGQQEGYLQMIKCLARHEIYSNIAQRRNNGETHWNIVRDILITPDMYNNNMFIGAMDFKTFDAHDEQLLTKMDTTPGNTTVQLNMKLDNGMPAQTQTVTVFIIHSSLAVLSNTGKMFLIE